MDDEDEADEPPRIIEGEEMKSSSAENVAPVKMILVTDEEDEETLSDIFIQTALSCAECESDCDRSSSPDLDPLSSHLPTAGWRSAVQLEEQQVEKEQLEEEQEMVGQLLAGLELRMRETPEDDTVLYGALLQQFLALVNRKDSLIKRQFRLNMLEKEAELERRAAALQEEVRARAGERGWGKDRLLEELVACVQRRSELAIQRGEEDNKEVVEVAGGSNRLFPDWPGPDGEFHNKFRMLQHFSTITRRMLAVQL
jgi:hypothetical protein